MPDQFPDYTPPEPAMAERWRRTLDAMGVHVVRARLVQSGGGSNASVGGLGNEHITKGYVEQWLRQQEAAIERKETRRYRWVLFWAVTAAVAGIVGVVVPLLK